MEPAPERLQEKPGWMAIALIAVFVLASVAMYLVGWRFVKAPTPSSLSSIGVRPFTDPGNETFGAQFAQQLAAALAKVPGLRVVAPPTAGMIAEVGIRKTDGRIYVTALLIPAGSRKALWARRYECAGSDMPRVADEIATGISGALGPR